MLLYDLVSLTRYFILIALKHYIYWLCQAIFPYFTVFKSARISTIKPGFAFISGDLLDEGSISSPEDFVEYAKRFKSIFPRYRVKDTLYTPGKDKSYFKLLGTKTFSILSNPYLLVFFRFHRTLWNELLDFS